MCRSDVCTEHISIGTVAGYWFNNFRFITLQIQGWGGGVWWVWTNVNYLDKIRSF